MSDTARPVAFVGDSHLLPGDGSVEAFGEFLRHVPGRFSRLVLVGDIFDLWLARPRLFQPHHAEVVQALQDAASSVPIDYVVGNRDYAVESWRASPFARVGSVALVDPSPAPAWVAEHGDLVNDRDRQYRAWRAFSRSPVVLGPFLALPEGLSGPLSRWLERRMRTTNLAYKRAFPAETAVAHAARVLESSRTRFLVLGHFHVELRLACPGGGQLLVLPDWKRAQRHLEWDAASGRLEFAASC